jgi:hypothetical protein
MELRKLKADELYAYRRMVISIKDDISVKVKLKNMLPRDGQEKFKLYDQALSLIDEEIDKRVENIVNGKR